MDNLDDSENNAKISDSAYSNSCSNSQSRRSHSSKSTHSGSNSSGSSGYGGKLTTSGYSNTINNAPEKRNKAKELKNKKKAITEEGPGEVKRECHWPPAPVFEQTKEDNNDADRTPPTSSVQVEEGEENMDISNPDQTNGKDETSYFSVPIPLSLHVTSRQRHSVHSADGFSCAISMRDGVVMYAASSVTTALGYPKDLWIGRSFIEFIHPRDHCTFASQITNGLSVPQKDNGTDTKAPGLGNPVCSMVCRIRRYRGLTSGFGIKDKTITFMPFTLKFFFKNINEEDGQAIYLVIQATPFFSAFKTPNEEVQIEPFVMRHSASGILEYIDPESMQYLGYLPQDIVNQDVLHLYHPSDLLYLRQVYENIVKEGAVPRSKPYRLLAQNGHYLRLETEWSSFINPWSKKLEFVTGKHYIIEGPTNPDVFQTPDSDSKLKVSDEEKCKIQALRQSLVRIMNEVLTKPAEAAKQQMTKRCQDVALFMETLIEETPKGEAELRLDVPDADNSLCERDSVMLGGISPHHDCNDSMSSTETPISYNQLNYNETLQRYFDSHDDFEDFEMPMIDAKPETQADARSSNYMSSMDCSSWEYVEGTSVSDSSVAILPSSKQNLTIDNYQQIRLTESLLNKHNAEMENELVKIHRENRMSKSERDKSSNEIRQKIKEHLARCNVLYPTTEAPTSTLESQPHGTKRASRQSEEEPVVAYKQRCRSPGIRSKQVSNVNIHAAVPDAPRLAQWPGSQMNSMNAIILGVGIPQPIPLINPMHVPGVFPMYYTPAINQPSCSTAPSNSITNNAQFQRLAHPVNPMYNANLVSNDAPSGPTAVTTGLPYQPPQQMPCMLFGQAVYGPPIMYSAVNPHIYAMQPNGNPTAVNNTNSLKLPEKNYEEACKFTPPMMSCLGPTIMDTKQKTQDMKQASKHSTVSNRQKSENSSSQSLGKRKPHREVTSEATIEKTDEESSYSSFYSSFFKTDSGSTEESDMRNKDDGTPWQKKRRASNKPLTKDVGATYNYEIPIKPKWEEVNLTSELIYKYQILTKSLEESLSEDMEKLKKMEQPSLVNAQLSQLYLDLQLEGVAARLTLEEGITSSSSSGEETIGSATEIRQRKREYSKIVMIYEENAPLPPPPEDTATSSMT